LAVPAVKLWLWGLGPAKLWLWGDAWALVVKAVDHIIPDGEAGWA
jgi:hypothetical protein